MKGLLVLVQTWGRPQAQEPEKGRAFRVLHHTLPVFSSPAICERSHIISIEYLQERLCKLDLRGAGDHAHLNDFHIHSIYVDHDRHQG